MATSLTKAAARAAGKPVQLKFAVLAGAAKETNIALTGVKRADAILFVGQFDLAAEEKLKDFADLSAEAAVTSDGNIQLSTTNTTGDKLFVVWLKAS